MFIEIAKAYNKPLSDFSLYPNIKDRDSWTNIPLSHKTCLIKEGERYVNYDYPIITATSYMNFLRTGNRVDFEDIYFKRRYALNALVLAECAENRGRFLDDIINGIFFLCEESGWQLPPHNSYSRHSSQELLADSTSPVLDLFACETGALLGTIYYLMGSVLDEVHPSITKRILHELDFRIIRPYLDSHFWWMGDGKEPTLNWTIWCTQNILITAFTTSLGAEIKKNVLTKAAQSIDYFLDDYGEDGCCDEGAGYYRHAGLCLFNTLKVLNHVSNNAFISLYDNKKIKNIATYILNVHVHDEYYANFADCSPIAGRAGVREFLFGKKIKNSNMMAFAAKDFLANPDKLELKEMNLFYRLQGTFTMVEIMNYDISIPIHYEDLYYESVGLFIARDNNLFLAVKAGDNDDNHNHNDTGSFTIYKDGKPLFIDIGVETYTKKTFSSSRYEIWTMQSAYHNLATINGVMQRDGKEYCAKDVEVNLSKSKVAISMDIASAYPKESGLLTYIRNAEIKKGKEIIIHDRFTLDSDSNNVILSLMTYEKPNKEVFGFSIGDLGKVTIKGDYSLIIEEIQVTDKRLQTAWKHNIYRVLLNVTSSEIKLTIQ
ncbi:MAG: heparinase [Clostridiales bacterium]|nr:heparinase [Clostridiales bacterium]